MKAEMSGKLADLWAETLDFLLEGWMEGGWVCPLAAHLAGKMVASWADEKVDLLVD
jgi:hypothetical protein